MRRRAPAIATSTPGRYPRRLPATLLLGVSFPRSGHHFLERLLRAAARPDYGYCEFYGPPGCCRTIPCARPGIGLHLQKNHDFGLDLPRDVAGVVYVLQTREPVGAAVSDRELHVQAHGPASAGHADHEVWLGRKAAHYVGFHERWIATPPPGPSVLVDYADLLDDPAGQVTRVLAAAGRPSDDAAVRTAVRPLLTLGDFRAPDYAPRPLHERPGFDADLLGAYESLVLDDAPALRPGRRLPAAPYEGTVVELAFRAARASAPGAAEAILDAGLRDHPGQPLLLHWRAQLARAQGDLAAARDAVEQADAALPGHPMILGELAHTAHAQGDLAAAISATRRLRERHADPGHEVLLAMLLGERGDRAGTVAQVRRARAAQPPDPEHWAMLARAAEAVGEQPLADATRAEARRLPEQL